MSDALDLAALRRDLWLRNYKGLTDEAKELEEFMKKNYKGHNYIPWATMVRLLYSQDPDAVIENLMNDDGGLVFTDTRVIEIKDKTGIHTVNTVMSHFVKVRVVFLGKETIEVYPVQDTKYESPKHFDSNMINKSIQRAKAKAISTATGLAFKLYEDGDLQFEDDAAFTKAPADSPKPVEKKVATKEPAKTVVENETAPNEKTSKVIMDLALFIAEHKPQKALDKVNVAFEKNFNTRLSVDDDIPTLITKISRVSNPQIFANSFYKISQAEDGK